MDMKVEKFRKTNKKRTKENKSFIKGQKELKSFSLLK